MDTIPPSATPNIAPSEERVKELRKRASNYGSLPESTVNDILDDYSALKAEVKRLNTWHSTLSEAWKARAEKAEAENEKLRNEQALSDKAWDIQRDKLEKAEAESDGWTEVLEDAANKHLRNLDKIARLEAELAVILDAHTAMQTELATLRCEAATLRAEREELKMMHRGTEEARYKLEAELAKQAPLIDAVMGANLFPAPTDGRTCIDSHDKIIRAALALREKKGEKE